MEYTGERRAGAERTDEAQAGEGVLRIRTDGPAASERRTQINVLIAHMRLLLADGMNEIVTGQRDMRVVGVATSTSGLLAQAERMSGGVVLLDADIAAAEPEIVERLAACQGLQVVLLMSRPDDMRTLAALRIGVRGVILETMGARLLLNCIRKVHAGGEWIEQTSSQRLLRRFALQQDPDDRSKRLTEREMQVVSGIARGLTNEQIGRELFINVATVKTHVYHLYRKLNLANRVALSTYARTHGLV